MDKRKEIMYNSGSWEENNQRIEVLYKNHHKMLMGTAYNLSKSQEWAEDLVQDLYVYLGEQVRCKIWFKDNFNLVYCINFLQTRWINKIKRDNKIRYSESIKDDRLDSVYDAEFDEQLDKSYNDVLAELDSLRTSKMWASSQFFSLYWIENPDETLAGLSKKIGLSNSTVFLNIKKVKNHLKNNIDNPFDNENK